MQRIKKIQAKGFYLLKGEASANSCFIENLREAKLFIKLVNRYLKDYIKVHEYLLTAEGWLLQVTIKRKKKVLAAYKKKKKRRQGIAHYTEVWRIISEQVRLMLAQYVIRTNRMEGRSGSKVKASYERFYFETAREARRFLHRMRNQEIKLRQRKKKYRKVKSHYTISKKEGKGSIFLCLKKLRGGNNKRSYRRKIGLKCLEYRDLSILLLTKKVKSTLKVSKRRNFQDSP